ncbi:MAG: manganese efflux pump MntP family protein [Peptostreptococcales bacterium]
MNIENLTTLAMAIALAMDTFAVSVSCGLSVKEEQALKNAMAAGLTFGIFQSGMTIIGWLIGSSIKNYLEPFNHWIAFLLLFFIGGKMIKESFSEESCPIILTGPITLITLAIATSIDALAAGMSYATLHKDIMVPMSIIGIVAFIFSFSGVYIGKLVRNTVSLGRKVDIIGGFILIGIGLKILLESILQ